MRSPRRLGATLAAVLVLGLATTSHPARAQAPDTTRPSGSSTTQPTGSASDGSSSDGSSDPEPTGTSGSGTSDVPRARLDLVTQSPTVTADGTFLLTVDLVDAPEDGEVEITLHRDPVTSRAGFSRTLFGVDLGERIVRIPAVTVAGVAPDAEGNRRFTVAIALEQSIDRAPGQIGLELGLARPGVYPLDLTLFDGEGVEQTRLITHLVRTPTDREAEQQGPAVPLRAAVLLDITGPPTIAPNGTDRATAETFANATAIAEVLAAVPGVAVTIDPTPETIEGMARHSDASRSALATLEDNLTGRQVLDGPYVELPLTAWLNAGMEDELNRERARGSRILNELSPDSSTWVAEPDLTSSAAADLWQSGVRHLVLRPGSFASVPASEEEPTPARPVRIASPIDSPLDAVAIDSGLQAAFGRQSDPELTVTQILAELSVIQGEAPTAARGVLLAAPPAWPVSTTFLEALLRGLDDHPLVAASTLEDLFREVAPARSAAGAPLVRRLTPALPPDLGTYPAAMEELRQMVNSYGSMVGSDDPILGQWDQRLLLSGYLRLTTAERTAYLSGIRQVIETDVAAIEAPARQTVTLTAREGNIPLTIRSRLDRPVRVVLALQSNSRLEYPDRVELMLEPGSQQVQIRVRARSPGDTPLTVRVLSPDSGIDLTETRITVRSTAVSGIGYVLSGGAALFLVVWWGRHWRRDRRARRIAHHPSSENPKPT